jgi:hypothetical protein
MAEMLMEVKMDIDEFDGSCYVTDPAHVQGDECTFAYMANDVHRKCRFKAVHGNPGNQGNPPRCELHKKKSGSCQTWRKDTVKLTVDMNAFNNVVSNYVDDVDKLIQAVKRFRDNIKTAQDMIDEQKKVFEADNKKLTEARDTLTARIALLEASDVEQKKQLGEQLAMIDTTVEQMTAFEDVIMQSNARVKEARTFVEAFGQEGGDDQNGAKRLRQAPAPAPRVSRRLRGEPPEQ